MQPKHAEPRSTRVHRSTYIRVLVYPPVMIASFLIVNLLTGSRMWASM
jgi:hypothetical protein